MHNLYKRSVSYILQDSWAGRDHGRTCGRLTVTNSHSNRVPDGTDQGAGYWTSIARKVVMRQSLYCTAIVALGMFAALNGRARADEAIDSTRETIIQGVRDDVRRKIHERNEVPSENRPEIASEGKPATPAPAHSNPKLDTPK
jgi:hypothetical protein